MLYSATGKVQRRRRGEGVDEEKSHLTKQKKKQEKIRVFLFPKKEVYSHASWSLPKERSGGVLLGTASSTLTSSAHV